MYWKGGGDTAYTFLMSEINGVGTPHNIERKHILGGGDTAHTLLGMGTPHNIYKKSIAVGGWVGGEWSKPENNDTLLSATS